MIIIISLYDLLKAISIQNNELGLFLHEKIQKLFFFYFSMCQQRIDMDNVLWRSNFEWSRHSKTAKKMSQSEATQTGVCFTSSSNDHTSWAVIGGF